MSKEITKIQKNILEYISDEKSSKGILPSLSDIAFHFGYKNRSTVREHLLALEKKGYIKRSPKLSRSIELLLEKQLFVQRPVLGEVAAGSPLTIYPDAIDTVNLPKIVKTPGESFLLKVKGDSLKDAYIFSGDIIIVNPNLTPKNGQIIAAILEDAAVVKRFYKKENSIELHSENPEYKPIIIPKTEQKFRVVGVVIGIYRSMERKAI
ncbi:MAG TPA: transcriptional repressor LexA [Ignavibacteriaceae bacterium]|nr:transcriptional repressor LexA [Ignavibacteriaceae bacterium]